MRVPGVPLAVAVAVLTAACTSAPPSVSPAASPPPASSAEAGKGAAAVLHDFARPRPARPARTFAGVVDFGGPVAGATVTFLDAAGVQVGKPLTTGVHGGFLRSAAGLPAAFTVVAKGGKVGPRDLPVELRAEVRDLTTLTDFAVVGVPSTVAAEAMKARAAGEPGALAAAAAAALGLGSAQDAHREVRLLDVGAIEAEAAAAGSFGAWAAARGQQLAAGQPFARSYKAVGGHRAGLAGQLASWVGGKIAGGLASYVGGQVVNMVLGSVLAKWGLAETRTTTDLMNDIDDINTSIADLQTSLDNSTAAILSQLTNLHYSVVFMDRLGPMIAAQLDLIDDINELALIARDDATPDERADFEARRQEILAGIKADVIDKSPWDLWANKLSTPDWGSATLTALYHDLIAGQAAAAGQAWGPEETGRINAWWRCMDAYMATTVYLCVEYQLAVGSPTKASEAAKRWAETQSTAFGALRGSSLHDVAVDYSAAGLGTKVLSPVSWEPQPGVEYLGAAPFAPFGR